MTSTPKARWAIDSILIAYLSVDEIDRHLDARPAAPCGGTTGPLAHSPDGEFPGCTSVRPAEM